MKGILLEAGFPVEDDHLDDHLQYCESQECGGCIETDGEQERCRESLIFEINLLRRETIQQTAEIARLREENEKWCQKYDAMKALLEFEKGLLQQRAQISERTALRQLKENNSLREENEKLRSQHEATAADCLVCGAEKQALRERLESAREILTKLQCEDQSGAWLDLDTFLAEETP